MAGIISRRNLFRRSLGRLRQATDEGVPATAPAPAAPSTTPEVAPPITLVTEVSSSPELSPDAVPEVTPETIRQRIAAEPAYRLILPRLLAFCCEPRTIDDIREAMRYYPEMRSAIHKPDLLLTWMVEAGAIYGSRGSRETPEAVTLWETTDAGREAIAADDPAERMRRLMEEDPAYVDVYRNILRFCADGRTLAEVEDRLRAHPALENPKVYPTYLLDRLEFAGALEWTGKWQTSADGAAFLNS